MAEEVFTFDPSDFMAGLGKVASGITGIANGAKDMAKNVSKGVMNAAAKIGLLSLAFKGIKSAISEMPEIGKTFGIAKDIFMKNLLFPLRQAVFPMLQKFLDWVRDNRAMFVKWGQVLVGIFHSVVGAVGKVIDVGKKLFGVFFGFINRVFGTNIKNLEDLLNVLTFKFAVIMEFLKSMVGPLIDFLSPIAILVGETLVNAFGVFSNIISGVFSGMTGIGDTVKSIVKSITDITRGLANANSSGSSLMTVVKTIGEIFGKIVGFVGKITDGFLKGFGPAIKNIMTPIQGIFDKIKGIIDMLFTGSEAIDGWSEAFKVIGDILGGVIKVALDVINSSLGWLNDTIQEITSGIPKLVRDMVNKRIAEVGEQKAYEELRGKLPKDAIPKLFPNAVKVDDAIIKPDGTVIRTNPADTIYATKSGMPGSSVQVHIDFTGMQLNISQATTEEATRFGENIVSVIRNQLNMELERAGVR